MYTFAVLVVVALVAAIVRNRSNRRGGRLLLASVAAVALVSWPPVAWVAAGSLEWWLPSSPMPEGEPGAIVVLSGYVHPPREHRPQPVLGYDTYMRIEHARWLHERLPELPILVTGGLLANEPEAPSLASSMRTYLVRAGVPEDLVWVEERSANTHQNAVFSTATLKERGIERIALVTEAYHMLRSRRCFTKQGVEVLPAPCGFLAAEFEPGELSTWLPSPTAARTVGRAVHEWLGLVWYKLRGWI